MSYALVFSGQASQHPTMLPWLEAEPRAAASLHAMGERIGADWRTALQDEGRRSNNAFAQVLITGMALAAWAVLRDALPQAPAVVAGYSVGELAAFACAGVFSADQAIVLAQQRATLMDQAVPGRQTGMMAVTGLSEGRVLTACDGLGLECAIRIHRGQSVFAGTDDALSRATPRLLALGAVCKRLDVRVASHSSWMVPAARAFADTLTELPFAAAHCAIATNADGTLVRQPALLRQALSRQLASPVQWAACMEAVNERQVACVLEIGAGSALSKMWNERYPDIPARSLDEFGQLRGAVAWLARHT
ncbi:MAG: malonate decarboxylase subunit epsilon [Rhodoferax sp.]|uniref:malonate decarboxylase subunit epsilon n=1 Tax=Rhodoferax sp. TaxID=50421 RepID=UPI0008C901A8|nr:malonate decarboxylase subunit epsilon [Rhodoferax sp.]MDP2680063.1 malonate decarboxylase subunit epsilon [Rhodoferax sp.]OGB51779.1 MAG: malonate decarboxylase subunit epsilon [Burkholderiales bacterium RIFOXYD12_FULL_59_19]